MSPITEICRSCRSVLLIYLKDWLKSERSDPTPVVEYGGQGMDEIAYGVIMQELEQEIAG